MLATIEKERRHGEDAVRPRYLSLRETVVLAGVPEKEKCVRKDIDAGVLAAPRITHLRDAHMRFNWPYVVTFAAVYSDDCMVDSRVLRKTALENVLVAVSGDSAIGCWNSTSSDVWHSTLMNCLVADKRVGIGRFFEVNLARVCESIKPRVDLYSEGLSRVEEDDSILGGRAVFRGTRLSVHHIGKMAENGESVSNILEDYPYLTEGDVMFAVLYNKARPLVGRPRASGIINAIDVG